eukprot:COSAG02_NODE_32010_length_523_cov_1.209906_1_plen_39_part_10
MVVGFLLHSVGSVLISECLRPGRFRAIGIPTVDQLYSEE